MATCCLGKAALSWLSLGHMQWERSWLEAQVGQEMTAEQREELLLGWGLPPGSKQRKRRLVGRLFDPDLLRCAVRPLLLPGGGRSPAPS